MTLPVYEDRRFCECEHSLDYHNDEGHCQAPIGPDLGTDCGCLSFKEAEGDTLDNLGVDVL